MKLRTFSNLHNLHFEETRFNSEELKGKKMFIRQIFLTDNLLETFFVVNTETLELYLYFEEYGTKQNPKLIKQGVLPRLYSDAIDYIHKIEKEIVKLYEETSISEIEELIKNDELIF